MWYCGCKKEKLSEYFKRLLESAGLPIATRCQFNGLRGMSKAPSISTPITAADVVRYLSSNGLWPALVAEPLPHIEGAVGDEPPPPSDPVADALQSLGQQHLETLAALLMALGGPRITLKSNAGTQ